MKARLLVLGLLLPACSSVLGLDTNNYTSTEDKLCARYTECGGASAIPDGGQLCMTAPCPDLATNCKGALDRKSSNFTVQATNNCLFSTDGVTQADCATFVPCLETLAEK